jgi:hypothetical protein
MSESERAQRVKGAIRRHLEEVGPTKWKTVRIQCPEVSEATFWRYVKAVRAEGDKKNDSVPAAVSPGPGVDDEVPCLGALPVFYNPLQKARVYQSLLADAEALRAHAVDRRGKITNARLFEKSILLRERLLSQQAEMMNFFQSQEATQLLQEQLIAMVRELPEEFAHRFIKRFHELQKRQLAAPAS